jgi:hypothetical protein
MGLHLVLWACIGLFTCWDVHSLLFMGLTWAGLSRALIVHGLGWAGLDLFWGATGWFGRGQAWANFGYGLATDCPLPGWPSSCLCMGWSGHGLVCAFVGLDSHSIYMMCAANCLDRAVYGIGWSWSGLTSTCVGFGIGCAVHG